MIQEHMTVCRLPITPGAPDLLHVTLKTLGHVIMDDGANVRFIQTHPERHCGHHDPETTGHEGVLDTLTLGSSQAGMVTL